MFVERDGRKPGGILAPCKGGGDVADNNAHRLRSLLATCKKDCIGTLKNSCGGDAGTFAWEAKCFLGVIATV